MQESQVMQFKHSSKYILSRTYSRVAQLSLIATIIQSNLRLVIEPSRRERQSMLPLSISLKSGYCWANQERSLFPICCQPGAILNANWRFQTPHSYAWTAVNQAM